MFSARPEYRLQTPLLMCVKLLKTASPGARSDYRENRVEGGECWIGLKPGSHSGVEARAHTHTHIDQVGSREPFNTHLRPRLKRQSTSSPGALQRRASPHAPPNFTHGCSPVEAFTLDFDEFQPSRIVPNTFFSTDWKPPPYLTALKSKLFKTFFYFSLCDSPHSGRQMQ